VHQQHAVIRGNVVIYLNKEHGIGWWWLTGKE
jgi:hypothetical protein